MDLILWRHAEAEYGPPDLERRLTPKGEKQARRVAQWLHDRLPDSARIVTSPALRTRQTAAALAELGERKLKVVEALAPDMGAMLFLESVEWPRSKHTIVAVGHQPTLGMVASLIMTGTVQAWPVKKGALWWFSTRDDEGDSPAALLATLHPGML